MGNRISSRRPCPGRTGLAEPLFPDQGLALRPSPMPVAGPSGRQGSQRGRRVHTRSFFSVPNDIHRPEPPSLTQPPDHDVGRAAGAQPMAAQSEPGDFARTRSGFGSSDGAPSGAHFLFRAISGSGKPHRGQ